MNSRHCVGEPKSPIQQQASSLRLFFFFFLRPNFSFLFRHIFKKSIKNIKTSPEVPVLGLVASWDDPLSFPTIAKIPPPRVPQPCAPNPALGGKDGRHSEGEAGWRESPSRLDPFSRERAAKFFQKFTKNRSRGGKAQIAHENQAGSLGFPTQGVWLGKSPPQRRSEGAKDGWWGQRKAGEPAGLRARCRSA